MSVRGRVCRGLFRAGLGCGLGRCEAEGQEAHLLCLERVVGRLDGHVLLAVDLDAVGDYGLGLALVGERGGDGAHLSGGQLSLSAFALLHLRPCSHGLPQLGAARCWRTYGEAWGRGPGSLAGRIADDGLVDVASANEAAVGD